MSRARTPLGRVVRRQRTRLNRLLRLPPEPTTRLGREPREPDPLPGFTLWGLTCTFMEADVIGATVANLFTQGCERVLFIDNDSPDDTVAVATAAGAELVGTFSSDEFSEFTRVERTNALMAELSREAAEPSVWWLHVDADELPHGSMGRTVRAQLSQLDRRYRIVGADFWNHFPTPGADPAYVPGHHPLDDQPLVEHEPFSYCWARHYKHPLVRIDAGVPPIRLLPGAHVPERWGGRRLLEPREGIVVHHLQFRGEAQTRARMEVIADRLVRPEPIADRIRHADAIYRGDWAAAPLHRGRLGNQGVRPEPWPFPDDVRRWDTPP